jgi:type VI secretion system protein ImpK
MSQEDPFALPDPDHTVILGPAGAKDRAASASTGLSSSTDAHSHTDQSSDEQAEAGLNPLVAAANALLNLVPQLRATLQHPDPAGLRDLLARQIREFEARARAKNIQSEHIIGARYALCTLLDEVAASTPWGSSGIWSKASLLVMFHNEAWGGEKFFQLLAKLAQTPAQHRDLLELMYICLSLGLEGRYHVQDNGKVQLDALRERLARLLQTLQGDHERALSPHGIGAMVQNKALLDTLPLWVALATLALVLLVGYFGFSHALNNMSDPLYAQIQALRVGFASQVPAAPVLARKPRLAAMLAPEIKLGLISVRDEEHRSVITLRGDGLFAPGSATVARDDTRVLQRIGAVLATTPGKILVVGHTDNAPIRSARFPSNWHLSQQRAHAVMVLLTGNAAAPARYSADGRADAEPIESNATASGRAHNRRVEIILTLAAENI